MYNQNFHNVLSLCSSSSHHETIQPEYDASGQPIGTRLVFPIVGPHVHCDRCVSIVRVYYFSRVATMTQPHTMPLALNIPQELLFVPEDGQTYYLEVRRDNYVHLSYTVLLRVPSPRIKILSSHNNHLRGPPCQTISSRPPPLPSSLRL